MIKKYWTWTLLSTLLTLSPILFGLAVWNRLPEVMAVHWGFLGAENGYMARGLAVFMLPLILAVINLAVIFIILYDNSKRDQSEKVMRLIFFLVPIVSVYSGAIIYSTAFGLKIGISTVTGVLFAVLFFLIGNYLPKCKQNSTVGIKISYTLANEENWNKTHRFGGKLFVIASPVMLIASFLPPLYFAIGITAVFLTVTVTPIVYSYKIYIRDIEEGKATKKDYKLIKSKKDKIALVSAIVILLVTVAIIVPLMFVGNIEYEFGTNALTVKSSYERDVVISYCDIESIELREGALPGSRIFGVGSARLLLGSFRSDELGDYARYTYTGETGAVIINTQSGYIALGCETPEETEELFNSIAIRIKER